MSERQVHRNPAIGVDVGGTGIKGGAVDLATGGLVTSRHRRDTPAGGRPEDIARIVGEMVAAIREELAAELAAEGRPLVPAAHGTPSPSEVAAAGSAAIDLPSVRALPVGVALPGVIQHGVMRTAANVAREWIGTDAAALLSAAVGSTVVVMNDADAAGVAEARYGAARDQSGTTLVLTFGTGIGSALLLEGRLVPNLELGHLELDGHVDIERFASAKAIEREGIPLAEWAARAARLFEHLERVLHPDRFVLGGSISKASDDYLPFLGVTAPVVPATLRNNAGIVGAARLAADG